ncbi:hypothetical protein HGRIS_008949 [Hohenbuehelia grisea]|uniref:Uncharacterized protein n=1 Tax=Hohenbuehelia grisea TaxID=104357 RepID=A0ABR3IZT1_9AGAR
MPQFFGQWFPKAHDPYVAKFYSASMLALLRPWRDIHLMKTHTTFAEALHNFLAGAPARTLRILENINCYHESAESAAAATDDGEGPYTGPVVQPDEAGDAILDDDGQDMAWLLQSENFSEDEILAARNMQFTPEDRLFSRNGIAIADTLKIFDVPGRPVTETCA